MEEKIVLVSKNKKQSVNLNLDTARYSGTLSAVLETAEEDEEHSLEVLINHNAAKNVREYLLYLSKKEKRDDEIEIYIGGLNQIWTYRKEDEIFEKLKSVLEALRERYSRIYPFGNVYDSAILYDPSQEKTEIGKRLNNLRLIYVTDKAQEDLNASMKNSLENIFEAAKYFDIKEMMISCAFLYLRENKNFKIVNIPIIKTIMAVMTLGKTGNFYRDFVSLIAKNGARKEWIETATDYAHWSEESRRKLFSDLKKLTLNVNTQMRFFVLCFTDIGLFYENIDWKEFSDHILSLKKEASTKVFEKFLFTVCKNFLEKKPLYLEENFSRFLETVGCIDFSIFANLLNSDILKNLDDKTALHLFEFIDREKKDVKNNKLLHSSYEIWKRDSTLVEVAR